MPTMINLIAGMYTISFLIMGLLVWEYWHIHNKRMELLRALQSSGLSSAYLYKYILTIIYVVLTCTITVATFMFFVQSHVL